MKKFIINIVLILVAFLIYFLQSNFFTWFNIAGVKPSMFVLFVVFIGLFSNKTLGTIYGIAIGLVVDLLVGTKIGITAVALGIVGFLSAVVDKNFSKDSRVTIMFIVLAATIIYEVVSYILNYIFLAINVEILNFIKILALEVIYNLILTIILYPLIQKFGYIIENEYKGNKILTRYF